MGQHTLYAYTIGLEFSSTAARFVERVNAFIESRQWVCPDIWAVNQQRTAELWELGINLCCRSHFSSRQTGSATWRQLFISASSFATSFNTISPSASPILERAVARTSS